MSLLNYKPVCRFIKLDNELIAFIRNEDNSISVFTTGDSFTFNYTNIKF